MAHKKFSGAGPTSKIKTKKKQQSKSIWEKTSKSNFNESLGTFEEMVWESGRRCQWAIRNWWLSSKAMTVLAAARGGGLAIVKRTWKQPRRGTVAVSGI